MITFNGKPLCDICREYPMAVSYDGLEMCPDCVIGYNRWTKAQEDTAIGYTEATLDDAFMESLGL